MATELIITEGQAEGFKKAVEAGIIAPNTNMEEWFAAIQGISLRTEDSKAYYLSLNDSKTINKAFRAIVKVNREIRAKFKHIENYEKNPAVLSTWRKEYERVFLSNRIPRKKIKRLYMDMEAGGGTWCYTLIGVDGNGDTGADSGVIETYEVYSSNQDLHGKILRTDTHTNFFAAPTIEERAEILGVPEDCKYLTSEEYDDLLYCFIAVRFLEGGTPTGQLQPEADFLPAISDPFISIFANTGRASLNKMEDASGFEDAQQLSLVTADGISVTVPLSKYFKDLLPNINAHKLLRQAIMKLQDSGFTNTTVNIPLKDIMEFRSVSDRNTIEEKVDRATDCLVIPVVKFKSAAGGFVKDHIADRAKYVPGGRGKTAYAEITFGKITFAKLKEDYDRGQLALYPKELGWIPDNKPTTFKLLELFHDHKRRNLNDKAENRLKVKTILKYLQLPTFEELSARGRAGHARQLIIDPLNEALSDLAFGFKGINGRTIKPQFDSWYFKEGGGDPISLQELEDYYYKSKNWLDFENLLIEVKWINEPDYSKERAARASHKPKKRGRPPKAKPQDNQPIE